MQADSSRSFLTLYLELPGEKSFFTSNPKPKNLFHHRIFEHNFGFKPFLNAIGLPFVFLWGMGIDSWGPDCAGPISPSALDDSGRIDDGIRERYMLFLSASAFGAMHFITWSFTMPTLTELWMWRSASIALTALPLLGLVFFFTGGSLVRSEKTLVLILGFPLIFLGIACFVVHPIIRLVIAADSVALLRDLPDTAFLVISWSDAIPSL